MEAIVAPEGRVIGTRWECVKPWRRCVRRPARRWSCRTTISLKRSCRCDREALRPGDGGVSTAVRRARRGATADADLAPADPIEGEPADVHAIANSIRGLAGTRNAPKLFLKAEPGDPRQRYAGQPRPRVASADREDGRGDPFRPRRFAGRDRADHRRLDGGVGLTGAMSSAARVPHSAKPRSRWRSTLEFG